MPTKTVRIIITIYEKLGDKIMITMQPTEHLVGINVQGDYYDFEAFVDAAHRLKDCAVIRSFACLIWGAVGDIEMNKKDQMTVENFVSTGMELETLYTCFPDFSKEEIAEIYNNYKDNEVPAGNSTGMRINCS